MVDTYHFKPTKEQQERLCVCSDRIIDYISEQNLSKLEIAFLLQTLIETFEASTKSMISDLIPDKEEIIKK